MPAITVDVSGDHWKLGKRLGTDRLPQIHTTEDWTIDVMEHGMQSGATSLMLIIPAEVHYDDGSERVLLMVETSLNAWMMASNVLAAHCRDEIEKPGWAGMSPAARAMIVPRYAEAIRRCIPAATPEQAEKAAHMMVDSLGADRPPETRITEP